MRSSSRSIGFAVALGSLLAVAGCNKDLSHAPVSQAKTVPEISSPAAGVATPVVQKNDDTSNSTSDSKDPLEKEYTAEYNNCMETGDAASGITVAMNECTGSEIDRQDARLNRAYKTAMAAQEGDQKSTLLKAQRAWIKYRDSKCSEGETGGTIDSINESGCRLDMTIQRAVELEQMKDQ